MDSLEGYVKTATLEILPSHKNFSKFDLIPKGRRVEIAVHDFKLSLDFLSLLQENYSGKGWNYVFHIPVRLIGSSVDGKDIVRTLLEKDVREIFVVGGDEKNPRGLYSDSLLFLEDLKREGSLSEFESVEVAAYPQGHGFLSDSVLSRFLIHKQPYCTGMITQMDFDSELVSSYLTNLQNSGITNPLRIGALGAVKINKDLFSLVKEFSAEKTLSYISQRKGLFQKMLSGSYSPSEFVEGFRNVPPNFSGFVFSTFNSIKSHMEWEEEFTE